MGDENSWGPFIKDGCIGDQCWAAAVAYTSVTIDETANLLEVITSGQAATGLWLGGVKYQIVKTDTMPYKDSSEYPVVLFAKGKRGGVIATGPTYTVIGLYDEEKEQTKNGCVGVVLEFCHAIKDM